MMQKRKKSKNIYMAIITGKYKLSGIWKTSNKTNILDGVEPNATIY